MYFQIRAGKDHDTVQALRTRYVPARKRTVSEVVFSFDAQTLEIPRKVRIKLSMQDNTALSAFLKLRRAELVAAAHREAITTLRPCLRAAQKALDAEAPVTAREATAIHKQIQSLQQALLARGHEPPVPRLRPKKKKPKKKGDQLALPVG